MRVRRFRWRLPDALPVLGPVAMRVYVAIWTVLLGAALAASAAGVHFGMEPHRNPGWEALGLTLLDGSDGPVVRMASKEARGGGIAPGDVILAIDGRPVPSGGGAVAETGKWVQGPDGTTRTLTIRTGEAPPRAVTLTRSRALMEQGYRDVGMTSLAFSVLLVTLRFSGAALLIVSAVLLFRKRRQPVAALLSLSFLALATSWGGGLATFQAFGQMALVSAMWASSWTALLLAIMTMPDGRFVPRWTRWLGVATILFVCSTFVLTLPDSLAFLLGVSLMAGAVGAMGLRYRKLPPGPERQQLRWSFFGFAIGATFYAVDSAVAVVASALSEDDPRWHIWDQLSAGLLISLALSSFALGLLVSLLRYRLYDADAVIGRSAGYAMLTLLLAIIFGVTAKLIEVFFQTSFAEDAGALPGAVGAGLVLTLIGPLHRRIQTWAELRFQKDITRLRRELPHAADDLRETATLDELLDEMLGRVMRGTRATSAAVVIDGAMVRRNGEEGEEWPTEVPLRITHQNLAVGTLLVGRRPDRTPVGKDEREALAEIADPMARAIRIVRAREAGLARQEARIAAIEACLRKRRRYPTPVA